MIQIIIALALNVAAWWILYKKLWTKGSGYWVKLKGTNKWVRLRGHGQK